MKRFMLVAVAALLLFPGVAQKNAGLLQATTHTGIVRGVAEISGVVSFKGIPFAAPPVGNLRWKEPQPAASWTGVRKADHFGPRAMQLADFGDMNFRSDGMSEDCLYLNVWTPAKKAGENLPVLVYFYGGGFIAGDGSEPRYDGESMATKGIVALTVNYRLGIFGFLAHPELTAESPHHVSGNYGLLDQAAALQWVKENIAAFGGNPNQVTIAGESAGSISVSAQMASPLSKNLFQGAIGESGSLLGTLSPVSLSRAEETGAGFGKKVGAPTLSELRKIPSDSLLKLVAANRTSRFSTTIDGYFLPKKPQEIFASGEQAKVPLMAGWNSEEMSGRFLLGNVEATIANYKTALERAYPGKSNEVFELYKPASDSDVMRLATALSGDRFIGYSTWNWSDYQAKSGAPVYRYYYEQPRPAMTPEMGDASPGLAGGVIRGQKNTMPPAKGAVHSAEIEYAMGNLSTNKVYAWTADDYRVSSILQQYFVNFIKNGDPNGHGLPQWPSVTGKDKAPVMHIGADTRLETETSADRYLWLRSQSAQ